jgi:hypothetical protein
MKYLVILLSCLALLCNTAEAKHRTFHHHHRYKVVQMTCHKRDLVGQCVIPSKPVRPRKHEWSPYYRGDYYAGRPRDCYGIAWCGCWLRHQFGLADTGLNLAANWLHVGSPATVDTGNIVVWPSRHHVGKLISHNGNKITVVSGNYGRHSGEPVEINFNGNFRFRRL